MPNENNQLDSFYWITSSDNGFNHHILENRDTVHAVYKLRLNLNHDDYLGKYEEIEQVIKNICAEMWREHFTVPKYFKMIYKENTKIIDPQGRFRNRGQITFYLPRVLFCKAPFDSGAYCGEIYDTKNDGYRINRFSHLNAILEFCKQLEARLREKGIRAGGINNSDNAISSYISFRQEGTVNKNFSDCGEIPGCFSYVEEVPAYGDASYLLEHSKDLKLAKQTGLKNPVYQYLKSNMLPPSIYSELTKGNSFKESLISILDDYTKNNSRIARFFTGHWNRNHTRTVHEFVNSLKSIELSDQECLGKLHEFVDALDTNININGSLMRRIAFITNLYKEDVLNYELEQQARPEEQEKTQESEVGEFHL